MWCLKGEDIDDLEELSDTECKGATEKTPVCHSAPEVLQERSQEEGEDDEEEDTTSSFEDCISEEDWQTCSEASGDEEEKEKCTASSDCSIYNSSHLLRKDELLEMFKSTHSGPKCKQGQLTVGLVSLNLYTHTGFIHFICLT